LRIIGGSRGGLRLKGPKGNQTRPTEDRIKESLFNILFDIGAGDLVLDLFAGSGSVGLEFISRGASKVYFVDRSKNSIDCINSNIEHTKSVDESVVIRKDYIKALNFFYKKEITFDYIFMDPPYEKGLIVKALEIISHRDLLKQEGVIIVEHESELELDKEIFDFELVDRRNYGAKTLSFYKNI